MYLHIFIMGTGVWTVPGTPGSYKDRNYNS